MRLKTILTKAAALLAALLLQFGAVQRLSVFSFTANLCVLAFVGVCFFSSPAEAVVFGAVFGLALDSVIGRGFGVYTLLYMYLGAAVKILASEKINNSPAIMAGFVWLFTALYYLAYGLLSLTVPSGSIGIGRWLLTALVTAVINSVVALPVFWGVCKLRPKGGAA